MTTEQLYNDLVLGSVIHGTHRPQDVIPALLDLLAIVDSVTYEGYMIAPFGPVPAYAMEDNTSSWWDSQEADYLLENLIDDLDGASPDGYCFGAHPGDAYDFGYWRIEQC